jgi:hypothetical protein
MLILEAADNNPMEAQRMENELSAAWWHRYMLYRKVYGDFMDEQERKQRRQVKRGSK